MKLSSLLGHTRELLQLVHESDQPADNVIESFFRSHKYLGSHDRRFIAETVYGTLRHLRRCDAALRRATGSLSYAILAEDGFLLLLVTYLTLVNAQTKLSPDDLLPQIKSVRLKSDIAGLLSVLSSEEEFPSDPVEKIGLQHSFPTWMVQRLVSQYGEEETDRICASLNEQAPLMLRVNTLKTTVEECRRSLEAEGVVTNRTRFSPVGLEVPKRINIYRLRTFQQGMFEVQDEGSQLLPLLVDPKPSAKLLDACAGAGGKALQFAALMKNRGEIVATDVSESRLDQLRKRARRAGVSNVRIKKVEDLSELAEQFDGCFDIVFVDAPCSGLGTIRRNPGIKWTVTEESVRELAAKQLRILNACGTLVKPGGKMVYATCTLLREENEDVVEQFLAGCREFKPDIPELPLSKLQLPVDQATSYVELYPHREGTDAFFCAVLKRVG